jgi:flagellar assembly protein FliH
MALRQVLRSGETVSQTPDDSQERLGAQLAELKLQHQQSLRDAHAAGMREGEAAGKKSALAELQPHIDRMARTIEELSQLRAHLRRDAEADMVKLSLAIARRVLRREMLIDPEALHGLVLAALEKLQGQELCRVKVNPAQAAMIKAALQKTATGGVIEVLPDAAREPGSVIFETQRGNLDASVESQLREIERGLTDCLRKQR